MGIYSVRLTQRAYEPGKEKHRHVDVDVDEQLVKLLGVPPEQVASRLASERLEAGECVTGWVPPESTVSVPANTMRLLNEQVAELEAELAARKRIEELKAELNG